MDIKLKIPPRPGGEVKIPANERKPVPLLKKSEDVRIPANERKLISHNEQTIQPLLKEGDPLNEWSKWEGREQAGVQYRARKIVGSSKKKRTWWETYVVGWCGVVQCPFCRTMLHKVHREFQRKWVGRDKQEYIITEMRPTYDEICPKCGYYLDESCDL